MSGQTLWRKHEALIRDIWHCYYRIYFLTWSLQQHTPLTGIHQLLVNNIWRFYFLVRHDDQGHSWSWRQTSVRKGIFFSAIILIGAPLLGCSVFRCIFQNLCIYGIYGDAYLPYCLALFHGRINSTEFICVWIDINQTITMPVFFSIQSKKLVTLVKTTGKPIWQPDAWPKDTMPISV